jgi:hypothetical protein
MRAKSRCNAHYTGHERELARQIKRIQHAQRKHREMWLLLDMKRNMIEARLGGILAARGIDRPAMLEACAGMRNNREKRPRITITSAYTSEWRSEP